MPAACQESPPISVLLLGWACRWKQSGSLTSPSQPGFSLCDPSAELCQCWVEAWIVDKSSALPPFTLCLVCVYCSHIQFCLTDCLSTESHESCLLHSGGGRLFIFPLKASWQAGGEELRPSNEQAVLDLETSSPHWRVSAPCCLPSSLSLVIKHASIHG